MEASPLTKMTLEVDEAQENLDWKTYQRKLFKGCLCGLAGFIIVAVIIGLLLASVTIGKVCNDEECMQDGEDFLLFLSRLFSIEKKVCSDEECAKIAEEFLTNMDTTVNPCDDFYKFACGRYALKNPIPEDKFQVSAITKTRDLLQTQLIKVLNEPIHKNEAVQFQNLKMYFQSCMNTERIEEIGLSEVKAIIQGLLGWPVVEDLHVNIDWESVLYNIKEIGLDASYLMHMFVDVDFKNSSVRILSITTPRSQLKRASLIKGKSDKVVRAYLDFMVQTVILFGADKETAEQHMNLVLDFEISLAEKTKSLEDIRANLSASYNLYSIEELEVEFPGIPWSDYIKNFIPKDLKLPLDIKVNLYQPNYTISLINILQDTPKRVIRNYIIWRAILDMAPYLNEDMRNLQQKFEEVVLGQTKEMERPKECLQIINELYLTAESALYIRNYFDENSKTTALELVTYIRDQFKKILNETKWSEQDKSKAIEKITSLHAHVGFPNELLNDKKLNSFYKKLEINQNFLQSSLKLNEFRTDFKYSRLFEPVNKTDWIDFAYAAVINAFYKHETNAIVLPAAILQGTFFDAKRPHYLNFAGIGSVIGHEMSHGFDDVGRQFNKDGEVEEWWSEVAERDFAKKKRCLVEQFNNYTIYGEHIKGNLTVGENIADFGGLKAAYLSYQNWSSHHDEEPGLPGLSYTNNQLFWIAAANNWCGNDKKEYTLLSITTNNHPPGEFRINGPMSNLEMFSKDFNCPIGSNMNPKKKCTPW